MVKLLIVDDDEIICQGLARCIDWEAHDIRVVDTVYDGELGLKSARLHRPDIMLVDINMPFMDGMELSYAIRQELPHIKILLLTAYKEFEYAQRAIQLQIFDYLSKPFRNEDVLQAVLEARDAVQADRRQRQELTENRTALRRKYLSQIISGTTQDIEKIRFCGFAGDDTPYIVGVLLVRCIQPDSPQGPEQALLGEEMAQRVALDTATRVFAGRDDVLWFTRDEMVVFVFRLDVERGVSGADADGTSLLDGIASSDEYFATLAVGTVCRGALQLRDSFLQAQRALTYHYAFSNNSVVHIEDVENRESESRHHLRAQQQELMSAIRQGDAELARRIADAIFFNLKEGGQLRLPAILFLVVEMLSGAFQATGDDGLYESFVEDCLDGFTTLARTQDIDDIRQLLRLGIDYLFAARPGRPQDALHTLAGQAAAFIKENYANPSLSLKMLADSVHISTSYLSILFRQCLGTSYVNYLNQVRMEHAKELLRKPGIKTYEVAFKVGYNSSQYFASSFKKYTGQTPGEYRNGARENPRAER